MAKPPPTRDVARTAFALALVVVALSVAALLISRRPYGTQHSADSVAAESEAPAPATQRSAGDAPQPAAASATREAEALDPGPQRAQAAAGASVVVRLSEPPATWYGRGEDGGNELHYRQLLRRVAGPGAVFSPELGRAAREMVFQFTELGREPPSDVRDFLIRGAGAVAADTTFQHATTSSDAGEVLERTLKAATAEPLDGDGPLIVGIGEVFVPGRRQRHIGVVATRIGVALEPTPRAVDRGGAWLLKGRLLVPYEGLDVIALGADGVLRGGDLKVDGDRLRVSVAAGDTLGPLDVQIVGRGPRGPGKLVQLQVLVVAPDQPIALADSMRFELPADESGLRDTKDATALAWQLLLADRAAAGVPALSWDPSLAAVAEAHSREMRDAGFFSHRSPTTGLHGDRLATAGYRAITSAENLALNVSIAESERGLLHSLGHRRNLLGRDYSHGAVGVVGEEREGGGRRWWVTQLFSRPVRDLDVAGDTGILVARIGGARRDANLRALATDDALAALARRFAVEATAGSLDGVGDRVLDAARAQGLLGRRLRAFTAATSDLDSLALPDATLAQSGRRLGVGLAQQAGGSGRIGVVVLVAE